MIEISTVVLESLIFSYRFLSNNLNKSGYFRLAGTHYTSWTRTGGKRWCKDGYPWGDDLEESRKKIQEYRCENCGIGYDSQTTEYRWVCYGHR